MGKRNLFPPSLSIRYINNLPLEPKIHKCVFDLFYLTPMVMPH